MANIKPLSDIATKWSTVTPARATEYEAGVKNPRRDWQQAAAAAASNYTTAVTAAASRGAYAKGIQKTSTANWQQAAIAKGAARFGQGVALAQPNYQAGFEPYFNAISSLQLPPRRPKGDPSNIQRVATIAAALSALKQGKAK